MLLFLLLVAFTYSLSNQECANLFPGENGGIHGLAGACLIVPSVGGSIDMGAWYDSEATCVNLYDGHLTSVHSEEENNVVNQLYLSAQANHPAINGAWIGGLDADIEGVFKWSDGSEFDYTKWDSSQPDNAAYVAEGEDFVHIWGTEGKWNDISQDPLSAGNFYFMSICKVPVCDNYQGDYIKGYKQCGFDDQNFQGDYAEDVTDIDTILEEMENEFIGEANLAIQKVNDAFDHKGDMYDAVVAAENAYDTAMTNRLGAEGTYNELREIEENAHVDLLAAIGLYDQAVIDHQTEHANHIETLDFLNYELYIIHEIRELLGENIGYLPEQTVIDYVDYDDTYDGFVTNFPTLHSSVFEEHRFLKKKKRKNKKRRNKKRKNKKRKRVKKKGRKGKRKRRS